MLFMLFMLGWKELSIHQIGVVMWMMFWWVSRDNHAADYAWLICLTY